jgi:hypothetical protein
MESVSSFWGGLRDRIRKPAIYVTVAGVGFALGRYTSPQQVEYRDRVQIQYLDRVEYRDRVVEKIVKVKDTDVKESVRYVYRTITKPDGTTETTKEITKDTDSSTKEATKSDTEKQVEVKKEIVIQKEIQTEYVDKPVYVHKDWQVGVGVRSGVTNFIPTYEGSVNRRIVGPFWMGLRAGSDLSGGVYVGFEF